MTAYTGADPTLFSNTFLLLIGLPRKTTEAAPTQKIDHFWGQLNQIQSQKVQQRKPQPATGHAFIDFELNGISTLTNIDAQIETKVKQLTQRELTRH